MVLPLFLNDRDMGAKIAIGISLCTLVFTGALKSYAKGGDTFKQDKNVSTYVSNDVVTLEPSESRPIVLECDQGGEAIGS
jgi:hypothetical protein